MGTTQKQAERTYGRVVKYFTKYPASTYRQAARKLKLAPSTVHTLLERALKTGGLVRRKCPTCGTMVVQVPEERGNGDARSV